MYGQKQNNNLNSTEKKAVTKAFYDFIVKLDQAKSLAAPNNKTEEKLAGKVHKRLGDFYRDNFHSNNSTITKNEIRDFINSIKKDWPNSDLISKSCNNIQVALGDNEELFLKGNNHNKSSTNLMQTIQRGVENFVGNVSQDALNINQRRNNNNELERRQHPLFSQQNILSQNAIVRSSASNSYQNNSNLNNNYDSNSIKKLEFQNKELNKKLEELSEELVRAKKLIEFQKEKQAKAYSDLTEDFKMAVSNVENSSNANSGTKISLLETSIQRLEVENKSLKSELEHIKEHGSFLGLSEGSIKQLKQKLLDKGISNEDLFQVIDDKEINDFELVALKKKLEENEAEIKKLKETNFYLEKEQVSDRANHGAEIASRAIQYDELEVINKQLEDKIKTLTDHIKKVEEKLNNSNDNSDLQFLQLDNSEIFRKEL